MRMRRRRLAAGLPILVLFSALGSPVAAQDDLDDILGGFDDEDEAFEVDEKALDDEEADASDEERAWSFQGDISQSLSVSLHDHDSASGTDYSGLQRFRTRLYLQFDADLPRDWKFRTSGYAFYDAAYRINGRSDYTDDVLDTHEYDVELMDTYVEGAVVEQVDLKLGRQVVNWGRSETFRVLDIVNPIDNREPGLMDIEDTRRPLGMVKVGWFHGPWTLTTLVIPEVRYGLLPGEGSDQFPDLGDGVPTSVEEIVALCDDELSGEAQQTCREIFDYGGPPPMPFPLGTDFADPLDFESLGTHTEKDFGKATEYMVNLTGVFSGWDVSLQAALYNDDQPHLDLDRQRFEHARLWMVGSGANYTFGAWLFKTELAYSSGYEFLWTSDEKSRLDAMVGVEYYGINDVTIVFEIAESHLFDFEGEMELFLDYAEEDVLQSSLRVTWNTWNDQLHFTALGLVQGAKAQDGSFVRLSGAYDVFDAFSVEVGFLLFQDGDSIFSEGSGDNDRFFASAKYSF